MQIEIWEEKHMFGNEVLLQKGIDMRHSLQKLHINSEPLVLPPLITDHQMGRSRKSQPHFIYQQSKK